MWFIESHLSHMTGVHGHSFIFISEFKVSVHIKTRWVIDRARGKTNQFMTKHCVRQKLVVTQLVLLLGSQRGELRWLCYVALCRTAGVILRLLLWCLQHT